jgi:hypothetical protein
VVSFHPFWRIGALRRRRLKIFDWPLLRISIMLLTIVWFGCFDYYDERLYRQQRRIFLITNSHVHYYKLKYVWFFYLQDVGFQPQDGKVPSWGPNLSTCLFHVDRLIKAPKSQCTSLLLFVG